MHIFFPWHHVKSCSANPRDTEVTAVNITPMVLPVDEENQYSNSDSSEMLLKQ